MKGMKKGVLGFIVFSMMVIGLFIPNKVYASEPSDFVIENGVLIKYRGSGGHVVIPDEITKIGDKAFEDCHKLTSVIIPDSVTEIGNSAFNNCSKLIRITIPNNVTEIGSDAFGGTPWLDKKRTERADHLVIINNILIDSKKAQGKVTIPDGVTKIGDSAFSYWSSLTSVVIPDSVTVIEDSAFNDCSKLTNITIPNSVTEIGYDAFGGTPWLDKKRTEHADHLVIINNIIIDGNKAIVAV